MSNIGTTRRDIPEVIQTSGMDCGPAALAALLQGHGIAASYGRLREVCQTSVDGTSLDTLERVARQLGLDARQVLLPPEAVFDPLAAALPGLVVLRREDNGAHFVVAWRRKRGEVQVMDPGAGRVWRGARALERELLVHPMQLTARQWLGWMTGPVGLGLLGGWLDAARVPADTQARLGEAAWSARGAPPGPPRGRPTPPRPSASRPRSRSSAQARRWRPCSGAAWWMSRRWCPPPRAGWGCSARRRVWRSASGLCASDWTPPCCAWAGRWSFACGSSSSRRSPACRCATTSPGRRPTSPSGPTACTPSAAPRRASSG